VEACVRVECYAGYKGNERPQAFYLGERRLTVEDVIDRWYGPDYCYFKVVADDGNVYILKYSESRDLWQLVFFSDKETNFEVAPDTWKKACRC